MLKNLQIALSVILLISSYAHGQGNPTNINRSAAIEGSIILPTNQATERYESCCFRRTESR
jgi:hypothetical protein